MTIDLYAGFAQNARLFQKREGIENNPIANHAAAAGTQHAAGHELKNKLLAVDDDGVTGIMSAGIAGHDREVLRQHVDDLPFALVAPLGAYDHRSFTFFQVQLHHEGSSRQMSALRPGSHT